MNDKNQEPDASSDERKKAVEETCGLFVATESAMSGLLDKPILKGEIAEEGSKILRAHPRLFKPLEIAYRA